MKKILIKDQEFWYRHEAKDKYILYNIRSYFYIINNIVLDAVILLSKKNSYSQITKKINKKYNLNLLYSSMKNQLEKIYGIK